MKTLKIITIMSILFISAMIKTYSSEPEWIHYHTDNSGLKTNEIYHIGFDHDLNKWIMTDRGIFMFDNTEWMQYLKIDDYYLWDGTCYKLYQGLHYFGTADMGIVSFDGNNWIRYHEYNSDMPSSEVLSLLVKDGFLWIGTHKGLVRFDGNDFITYNVDNSGLPGNFILSLEKDSTDNMWIGTDFGAVRYDGENWDVYDLSNSELPNRIVYYITVDANNKVWFGTHYGLAYYDGQEWQKYTTLNSEIPEDEITALAAEGNKLWIGTIRKGLVKLENGEFTAYNSENSGFYGLGVADIAIDRDGNKWIGALFNGVQVYREGGIILSAEEGGGPAQPGAIVFPNPSENSVVFEYTVEAPGGVLLEIYGSDGRKAAVPMDSRKAPGTHKATVDVSALPPGVYHYRLKTRKGVASGSFVVTK